MFLPMYVCLAFYGQGIPESYRDIKYLQEKDYINFILSMAKEHEEKMQKCQPCLIQMLLKLFWFFHLMDAHPL